MIIKKMVELVIYVKRDRCFQCVYQQWVYSMIAGELDTHCGLFHRLCIDGMRCQKCIDTFGYPEDEL